MRVSFAVQPSRSAGARLLALSEAYERPGIDREELTARLREATGLAASTVGRLITGLEREGHLDAEGDGRAKTYRPRRRLPAARKTVRDLSRGTHAELGVLVATVLTGAGSAAFFVAPFK